MLNDGSAAVKDAPRNLDAQERQPAWNGPHPCWLEVPSPEESALASRRLKIPLPTEN